MFDRRSKAFLLVLILVFSILLVRAAQVQIINRNYWKVQAIDAMKHTRLVDSTRGTILDRTGRILAIDKPCIDACIDYRALTSPPDAVWVKDVAIDRLKTRLGDAWGKLPVKRKNALREEEIAAVHDDIDKMWERLATLSGRSLDEIEDVRDAIVRRVQMRQRYIWYRRSLESHTNSAQRSEGEWRKWIAEGGGEETNSIDEFHVVVAEQLEPHVILPAVNTITQNALGKEIDEFPGLILRPGTHRTYPCDDLACHLIGHIGRVAHDDLDNTKKRNELRDYLPNDLIGKAGIELYCEPALRGTRGRIDRVQGEDAIIANQEPAPGKDVHLSIDIELQRQIQSVFASALLLKPNGEVQERNALLHGAAVVIDVETNQVLALVSYPTYDLNSLDEMYPQLREDEINEPLRNRATMSQLEPGSTIKPLCGLAGISEGVVGVNEGIECTGALKLDGHYIAGGARCWVSSSFGAILKKAGMSDMHHPIPYPHVGHDGNRDGWLTYSDALERSCNIYFETVADRLGLDRLSNWYEKFGLGRPTGIGIGEAKGRIPHNFLGHEPALRRIYGFLGGIGQGYVAVTPIQMANAVAMIARKGIWMRPQILLPEPGTKIYPEHLAVADQLPDRLDLHLPPQALQAAWLGMYNVVNARAGTGKGLVVDDKLLQDLGVCGKTGTAQAAKLKVHKRDANGKWIMDADNKPVMEFLAPSTPDAPNPAAPWYRAKDAEFHELNHAWYIGFAPAAKPKIAFAVMIEYGGSGGVAAAAVGRATLEACIKRGYIPMPDGTRPTTQAVAGQ